MQRVLQEVGSGGVAADVDVCEGPAVPAAVRLRDDAVGAKGEWHGKGDLRDRSRGGRGGRGRRRSVVFVAGDGVGERDRSDRGGHLVLPSKTLGCLLHTRRMDGGRRRG